MQKIVAGKVPSKERLAQFYAHADRYVEKKKEYLGLYSANKCSETKAKVSEFFRLHKSGKEAGKEELMRAKEEYTLEAGNFYYGHYRKDELSYLERVWNRNEAAAKVAASLIVFAAYAPLISSIVKENTGKTIAYSGAMALGLAIVSAVKWLKERKYLRYERIYDEAERTVASSRRD